MHEWGMEDFSIYNRYCQGASNKLIKVVLKCECSTKCLYFVPEEKRLLNILEITETLFNLKIWRDSRKDFIYPLYIFFICKVGHMGGFQGAPCAEHLDGGVVQGNHHSTPK